jgi:thiol-disulfide isomerase/thioredoxin
MQSSDQSSSKPTQKGFWTTGRIVLTLVGFSLIGALSFSSCNSNDESKPAGVASSGNSSAPNNPNKVAPPNVPNNAPPAAFVSLPDGVREAKLQTLDGESLKLSDYTNKVVIVNIWATWCGPCRQEMPELVKISNEYKSRGVVVLGLATTYNEQNDANHVRDYIKQQNVPYKIIWDDGTLAGPLVQAVQGRAVIPQSFVIARDGRIVKHFQGFSAYSTPQLMRQAVEEALNNNGKA